VEIALQLARPAADQQWLERQRGRLFRIALSVLRNHEEAEDVVQETLLAFVRIARRSEIRAPEAYLARAVRWNAVKHRARRRRHPALDGVAEPGVDDRPNRLDAIELERAIAGLPLAQQTVIRLRFYLGLTFQEIGTNLSISTNTAASRTRYALANLRRQLGGSRPSSTKEADHG
jgi:RNA polymerase sigma-70 factor (ECF subfamily)